MHQRRTLAFRQLRRWIAEVDFDPLHQRAECRNGRALAAFGHFGQHIGCQLQVPRIVELAGFQNRTAGRGRIAAALEVDVRKGGLARVAVVFVRRERDHVVWTEIRDCERTRADRSKVRVGTFGCARAQAIGKLRGLDDGGLRAHEGTIGVRLRRAERHFHGQIVNSLDGFHAIEFGQLRATAFGVHAVLSGEKHVG